MHADSAEQAAISFTAVFCSVSVRVMTPGHDPDLGVRMCLLYLVFLVCGFVFHAADRHTQTPKCVTCGDQLQQATDVDDYDYHTDDNEYYVDVADTLECLRCEELQAAYEAGNCDFYTDEDEDDYYVNDFRHGDSDIAFDLREVYEEGLREVARSTWRYD